MHNLLSQLCEISCADLMKIKVGPLVDLIILIINHSPFNTSHNCNKSCAFFCICRRVVEISQDFQNLTLLIKIILVTLNHFRFSF